MPKTETPDERKQRLLRNLEKARAASKAKREAAKAAKEAGQVVPAPPKKRPRNLDRIVRDILDDEYLVDLVVHNQPDWWAKLELSGKPKTAANIIGTVMAVKAMGGDIKAAEWIRKTGFGDKVLLETDNGFFAKDQFTIQVVPSREIDSGIDSQEVLEAEIQQIEDEDVS